MCKLTDDWYNVASSFQLSWWNWWLLSVPSYWAALIASFDIKSWTDYTITVPTVTADWYGTLWRLDFVITDWNNSSNIIKHRNSYWDLSQWETTVSSSELSWKTKLWVWIYANWTWVGTHIYCWTTNVSYTETLYKSWTSLPYRDLVWLWSLCWITILWDHIDWERIDHGNWLWLPLEFVETFSVSSSDNRKPSWKTYNYDIYVICKWDDDSTNFNVCSYYNWYTYPWGSSYASHFWIDSWFVKAWMTFWTIKIWWNQVRTWTYYIYKLNLPS